MLQACPLCMWWERSLKRSGACSASVDYLPKNTLSGGISQDAEMAELRQPHCVIAVAPMSTEFFLASASSALLSFSSSSLSLTWFCRPLNLPAKEMAFTPWSPELCIGLLLSRYFIKHLRQASKQTDVKSILPCYRAYLSIAHLLSPHGQQWWLWLCSHTEQLHGVDLLIFNPCYN